MSDSDEINSNLNDAYDALEKLSESISNFIDSEDEDEDKDGVGELLLSLNRFDDNVVGIYTINDEYMATINVEFLPDFIGLENSNIIIEDLKQGNIVNLKIKPEIL